ncbi:activating transcription factor 4b [Hippoglossus hippoglossus]|uniref:activating transcription factor 4b n=1 Tax=Hippoglossus hippoglossus TaxID=8267 RepID=UPI00148B4139|nr:activating transcription factor 4b [Hippoglossus hippoglossus]
MTMTMTNSQFGLEDMEALLWGPSSPTADAMGSLFFHPDQEENQEGGGNSPEGDTSPVSPLTSLSLPSPPNFYSPPSSPPAVLLHGDKAGNESALLSLPWLEHPDQLGCQTISDDRKEDPLGALDWMAEKMDLSEFDLDSLIGSCSPPEESISSTEDLLASLDCPMELDSLPVPTLSTPVLSGLPCASPPSSPPTALPTVCEDASVVTVEVSDSYFAHSPPTCVPEPQEELEIKSEPASPDPPAPMVDSPSSPVDTLDLGSEVDVSETEEKPVLAAVVPQVHRFVFSLTPTRIVLVLAPKNEVGIATTTVTTTPEVVHSSPPACPPQRSFRSRPYPEPKYKTSPPSPGVTTVKVKSLCGGDDDDEDDDDDRVTLKAPKEKKLKKMAQNKTAATRYRQKKRSEQDSISSEHSILERKNMELREKAESMAREIEYLKELMEEVRTGRTRKGLRPDP